VEVKDMTLEDCEFFVNLGPSPEFNGWLMGYCSIERADPTFNAMTDCVKKTCRLHSDLGFVLDRKTGAIIPKTV
jgi:hypothetical protein